MVRIKPYAIDVPQEVLDDLREGLRRTRWPNEIPGTGWARGLTCPTCNVVRFTELSEGGHFAIYERAAEMANDLHELFRPLKK